MWECWVYTRFRADVEINSLLHAAFKGHFIHSRPLAFPSTIASRARVGSLDRLTHPPTLFRRAANPGYPVSLLNFTYIVLNSLFFGIASNAETPH